VADQLGVSGDHYFALIENISCGSGSDFVSLFGFFGINTLVEYGGNGKARG
jgi:hypothetical protein